MRLTPAPLVAALAIAGCGGAGETTSYTTPYKELASSGTPAAQTATPEPTPSPTPTPTPSPTPAFDGTPVEGGKVTVIGTEFKFDPAALSSKPGKIQVTLDNQGAAPHEIVFIKTDADEGSLTPGSDGTVPEKGAVGEVSAIPGGQTKTATVAFKPGHYVYVCNVPGHYQSGMHGTLVVQ